MGQPVLGDRRHPQSGEEFAHRPAPGAAEGDEGGQESRGPVRGGQRLTPCPYPVALLPEGVGLRTILDQLHQFQ